MPDWGVLPEEALAQLRDREWHNRTRLKAWLKNTRPLPLSLNLKPPTSKQAIQNPEHFQKFVAQWQRFSPQYVEWQTRQMRDFSAQTLPCKLVLRHVADLVALLGADARREYQHWQTIFTHLFTQLPQDEALFAVLLDFLPTLTRMREADLEALLRVAAQLHAGMGGGQYLRALPLVGVDSKFVENHQALISAVLDVLHHGAIRERGLLAWLNCQEKPKDWLLVRPLCAQSQRALGGLSILRLPTDVLRRQALPARHIVVVENEQSVLALPSLPNTIAVGGGGHNVAWLDAAWLRDKRVAYWGDVDGDGLTMLARARTRCPHLHALMMDRATWAHGAAHIVADPARALPEPTGLNAEERALWHLVCEGDSGAKRLEQERLAADYLRAQLAAWHNTEDA